MMSEATLDTWSGWWAADPGRVAEQRAAEARMTQDADLVERCRHGDHGAWEHLVRSHTRLVYSACYRFTNHTEESNDLTQEVFLRVFRSLNSYDARAGGFRTWLLRLTRNLLIDNYRRTKKHRALDPLEDQITVLEAKASSGGHADQALLRREAGEMLQAGLQRMSPELREAVILRDIEEMEYKEIAQVLRIPAGTVKSRINRGRSELGKQLRALGVRP